MGLAQTYRLIAGAFVVLSTVLGIWVHPAFLWLTLLVGVNILQSGFTNWCPLMAILGRTGMQA